MTRSLMLMYGGYTLLVAGAMMLVGIFVGRRLRRMFRESTEDIAAMAGEPRA